MTRQDSAREAQITAGTVLIAFDPREGADFLTRVATRHADARNHVAFNEWRAVVERVGWMLSRAGTA